MKVFKNNEMFKKLIVENDSEAATVISSVFVHASIAKIDVVCNEIKKRKFDGEFVKQIFTSKTTWKRNLLMQLTINSRNSISVIEHGWSVVEEFLGRELMTDLCTAIDARGYNLLLLTAECCSEKVFDFAWRKIISFECDVKKVLSKKTQNGRNILHAALYNRGDLEVFKVVWQILMVNFNKEVMKFLTEFDIDNKTVVSDLKSKATTHKQFEELDIFLKLEIERIFTKSEREEIYETSNNTAKKSNFFKFW